MFEISDDRAKKKRDDDPGAKWATWDNEERKVQIQDLFDRELNPAVAMHGGYVAVLDVKDTTVFVQMLGGCQGCGMASVTLKQGVEAVLRHYFPHVGDIL